VPFSVTPYDPVAEAPDDAYPLTLTTGRRLEFYNTGVQTRLYGSARPQEEILELNPQDADALGVADGETVRIRSRRGALELRARRDPGLYRGLCFMTLHHPDQVLTNLLTINATDPVSGTAEFKCTAVAVEKITAGLSGQLGAAQRELLQETAGAGAGGEG
jgi:formate dehydrogenase major subunit